MKTLKHAALDTNLTCDSLAILCFMYYKKDVTQADIQNHFNKSRSWCFRHMKLLKAHGYISSIKLQGGPEQQLTWDWIVNLKADIHELVEDTPSRPPSMKWLDPLTTDKTQYSLSEYYLQYNFPMPKTVEELVQAKQIGMRVWAMITKNYVGWINAETINKTLGTNPNEEALRKAWEQWNLSGYKPNNVRGILEWYTQLAKDINSTPWSYRSKNGTSSRRSKKVRKEHGTTTVKHEEIEYATLS
jgi:hypothetical protein